MVLLFIHPKPNFNGIDLFTYQLCDSNGDCSQAKVTVTVVSVNDIPVAANDVFTMAEGTELAQVTVATNDLPSGDGGNSWNLIGATGGGRTWYCRDGL